MKKIQSLLLIMLLATVSAKAQTGWVTKNLSEKILVKFPEEPKKTTTNGFDVYTCIGKDSVAYSGAMVDYKVIAHLDSATLVKMKDQPRFADQLKTTIAAQKKNYAFGDITIGKWKTYTMYTLPATDIYNKSTLVIKMILVGSKMHTISCRVPAGLVTQDKEQFFSAIEVVN